jgi:protein MAK11
MFFFFQSGVTDIAIHPSGKLALSIGKDRKLVTWNLIKGRSAYVTNIKDMANFVKWSPTG